jgi:hypothetical protein
MTQTGAEYDHNAGITALLHRHNLETAYGHNLVGNMKQRWLVKWDGTKGAGGRHGEAETNQDALTDSRQSLFLALDDDPIIIRP